MVLVACALLTGAIAVAASCDDPPLPVTVAVLALLKIGSALAAFVVRHRINLPNMTVLFEGYQVNSRY
jgi:hypothetical protein